jgi:hypothetical protein
MRQARPDDKCSQCRHLLALLQIVIQLLCRHVGQGAKPLRLAP